MEPQQEAGEEICKQCGPLHMLVGLSQASSPARGAMACPSREVPRTFGKGRGLGDEDHGVPMQGAVPPQEGAHAGHLCRPCRHAPSRIAHELLSCSKFPRVFAEEELVEREESTSQDDNGETHQIVLSHCVVIVQDFELLALS